MKELNVTENLKKLNRNISNLKVTVIPDWAILIRKNK
jgi:hypothetical protein